MESLPGKMYKKIVRVWVLKSFSILLVLQLSSRRAALGWPLAISQEERLSYGIVSPFYAGRLVDFVDSSVFRQVCFCTQLPASGEIASLENV
ncbi:hypothetical protein BHE17_15985 [Planococcus maritimus]|nr:hypothetical protein BHE17_15985 [Planococcus maritimus]